MRYLTLHVNDNAVIDIENSIMGKETILYNGEVMSEFSSVLGGTHRFEVLEAGETVRYEVRVSIKAMLRVGIDIYRNDKILLLS
jgi:hypothetical protein